MIPEKWLCRLQTIFQESLILNLQARFRNLQRRPILICLMILARLKTWGRKFRT